ncbi:MAG: biosynthetic-type acetolactate synthase large subunit, partial [Chitinivibrionales bacterium]
MDKTGAEILIDALIQEDVEVIFGYPGGVLIPIFDALYDADKIQVVLSRHEQGAAHAADGYARVTGRPGVCMATSGPGATNLITGIATAYLDSIPMIAITGQVASPMLGTDAFQEVDAVGITRSITKHNFLVKSVEELPSVMKKAFHIASTGRPGPVHIDIPKDVSTAVMKGYSYPEEVSMRSYKPNVSAHERQIKRAAAAIEAAEKPLIYAGGGIIISGAHEELKMVAEKINAPVTTTFMGLGGFPETHDLFLGMPGMHGSKAANYALQETDLIISVGARFDDRVTGNVETFAPNAKIVHMDIDPAAISKIIKVDIPVVGDAKDALTKLFKRLKSKKRNGWNETVQAWKKDGIYRYEKSDKVVKPQYVIQRLYEKTKGDAVIATEVGQNQMWAAQYYYFDKPRRFLSSGGLGTMGYGMPAAMGAAFAFGGKKDVYDIAGDGSIQMNIQELATIANHKLPVKVVILNNRYLGMVRQWQELFFDKRYSSTCLSDDSECGKCAGPKPECGDYVPDFIKLAESYGICGYRAKKASEVEEVLDKGINTQGPVILEFMVPPEENVFPMVPAG